MIFDYKKRILGLKNGKIGAFQLLIRYYVIITNY